MSAKQEVQDLLSHLPDDCTYEDIQYHLYVRQKVDNGLSDVREGRVLSLQEAEKRLGRWLTP